MRTVDKDTSGLPDANDVRRATDQPGAIRQPEQPRSRVGRLVRRNGGQVLSEWVTLAGVLAATALLFHALVPVLSYFVAQLARSIRTIAP